VSVSPINHFSYPSARSFFNCGAIAHVSKEASAESERSLAEHEHWSDILDRVKGELSPVFAPDDPEAQPVARGRLALFHNTTGAIQRVLSCVLRRLGGQDVSLLTTDFEYPGCIAALDDQWVGPVHMVPVSQYQFGEDADHSRIGDALKQAFLYCAPRVVYLSHVSRYTGYAIQKDVLSFFRDVNPRCVIILDGAQGAGNVFLSKDLLSVVDYYITSGQKWLGGVPTIGIVWSKSGAYYLEDYAQSLALRTGSGGTANLPALRSLTKSLQEMTPKNRLQLIARHNHLLVKEAIEMAQSNNVIQRTLRPIQGGNASGILGFEVLHPRFRSCLLGGSRIAGRKGRKATPVDVGTSIGRTRKRPEVCFIENEDWAPKSYRDLVERVSASGRGIARWSSQDSKRSPRLIIKGLLNSRITVERLFLADSPVPLPKHGILRVCLHHYHGSEDVSAMVHCLERAARLCTNS
jgi:selenocysteine lyase/cysteine desulfurase